MILPKIKDFHLYSITFFMLLFINSSYYFYEKSKQEEKDLLILSLNQINIKTLLLSDLEKAINGIHLHNRFFILKNFTLKENMYSSTTKTNNAKISRFNQYAIYVEHPKGELILDLQDLKEAIDKLIPKYISYKVVINMTNIAISKNYDPQLTLKESYNLDKDTSLQLELGIDTYSDYYISNKKIIYTKCLFIALLTTVSIFTTLLWLLRMKSKSGLHLTNLEKILNKKEEIIQAFNQNKQMEKNLKLLFIRKATEMYIKKEVASNSIGQDIIKSIEPSNYLFPMRLKIQL